MMTSPNGKKEWAGLDGEGITVGDPYEYPPKSECIVRGEHKYISMSWRTATGEGDEIVDRQNGLTTKDCLEFILSIPDTYRIAAYGLGYDLAKILEELPAGQLYELTHPETRSYVIHTPKGKLVRYHPIIWKQYALDLFNTRFTVGRAVTKTKRPSMKDARTVHDLLKFYQCRFVQACRLWSVGKPSNLDTMQRMKDSRSSLKEYRTDRILAYSNEECEYLAELANRLDQACLDSDINLNGQYYGAGSIAKALLRKWGIKIANLPPSVNNLARHAFFGGRFEIAMRGCIRKPVHDWDISSAYPYAIFKLPCMHCGEWSKTKDIEQVKASSAALVKYELAKVGTQGTLPPWGPFPFREEDGSIPFPIESGGGWIHRSEFLAALPLFPNIRFQGAWVYETECDHRPFEKIRDIYLARLRLGKEGPGIVLKLGANAIAGSIMQIIGSRPYHCPLWAGMITAETRAQLLEMLGRHERWSDVIMMATDGLWSLSQVTPKPPDDTGTDIEVIEEKTGKKNRKPLGGWEHGLFEGGVFMARPGVYFPLDLVEHENADADDGKIKDVKARGIGIHALYRHRAAILEHYEQSKGKSPYIMGDKDPIQVIVSGEKPRGLERFVGLKGGVISKRTMKEWDRQLVLPGLVTERDGLCRKRILYGKWIVRPQILDFTPLPKREEGDGVHLAVRRIPHQMSCDYERMRMPMSINDQLNAAEDELYFSEDQPDYE